MMKTCRLHCLDFSVVLLILPVCLFKMEPSLDPLPFKLYLGFTDYPTETNYVAMTQMPLQGTTEGNEYGFSQMGPFGG